MNANIELTINKIIECVRLDCFSDIGELFKDRRDYHAFIDQIHRDMRIEFHGQNLHYYETFHRLADKYDFDSLKNLIKGLTIVENIVRHGGSVSPIIALYKKLIEKAGLFYMTTGDKQGIYFLIQSLKKSPNNDIVDLTHWILENSNNIYLPFGISTLSSKTIPEIKIEVENWLERQKERAQLKKKEKIDKEHRDELRKQKVVRKTEDHKKKIESEREYRDSLKNLTSKELMEKILNDKIRPVYYYYSELNNICKLDSESSELLKLVILRFKEEEKYQFKRLKRELIYLIEHKEQVGGT
ncbi:MAG: hypothetical protein KF816_06260 [Melioribacteraceae bacterium]|nr:hypothetical protein [Melioribacteraceae bacterium]